MPYNIDRNETSLVKNTYKDGGHATANVQSLSTHSSIASYTYRLTLTAIMTLLAQIRASNAQLTEATTPRTAVFVGATDGIGKRALTKLVSTGFPLKAYVIGRNKDRDQALLRELCAINNKAELVYLEGQISLMSEVIRLTSVILEKEQKIDILFHSAAFLPFLGRQGM
jgi:hypothetical protein